jgi:hypothetical protein
MGLKNFLQCPNFGLDYALKSKLKAMHLVIFCSVRHTKSFTNLFLSLYSISRIYFLPYACVDLIHCLERIMTDRLKIFRHSINIQNKA